VSTDGPAALPNQAPVPSRWERFKTRGTGYIGLDPRSLALFRIALAFIMLADLHNRAYDLDAHYTDRGVLPRDEYVDRFMGRWIFSFHMLTGQSWYMHGLFAVQAVFAVWLLFGYRTRIAVFLCWLFTVSLHGRQPMVLQAGDVLYRVMLFWSLFVPLGARYSIDAALNTSDDPPPTRLFTMGTVALVFQVVIVYWFTVPFKSSPHWWPGVHDVNLSAVYFALSIDHFATPFAHWMLQFPTLMKGLTFGTVVLELGGPLLALSPWFQPRARMLAVVLMIGLHVGFGLGLTVGMFVFISAASWLPLIPTEFWDGMGERLAKRRRGRVTIYVDTANTARHKLVLVFRELLGLPESKLVGLAEAPEARKMLGEDAAWGVRGADGAWLRGAGALAALGRGAVLWPLLPVVFQLAALGLWITVSREGWVLWLLPALIVQLFALWLLVLPFPGLAYHMVSGSIGSRVARKLKFGAVRWRLSRFGNVIAGVLVLYVLIWNIDSLSGKHTEYKIMHGERYWMKRVGWALRIDQRWNMFSPHPMKSDGWFVMAGTTRGGKALDVWRDINPDVPKEFDTISLEKPKLASAFYPGQRWRKYLMNIFLKTHKDHRLHFGRWVCRTFNKDRKRDERLETFHMMYVKERTTVDGHEPLKCSVKWRHWCTTRGKSRRKKPDYEQQCKAMTGLKPGEKPKAAKSGKEKPKKRETLRPGGSMGGEAL